MCGRQQSRRATQEVPAGGVRYGELSQWSLLHLLIFNTISILLLFHEIIYLLMVIKQLVLISYHSLVNTLILAVTSNYVWVYIFLQKLNQIWFCSPCPHSDRGGLGERVGDRPKPDHQHQLSSHGDSLPLHHLAQEPGPPTGHPLQEHAGHQQRPSSGDLQRSARGCWEVLVYRDQCRRPGEEGVQLTSPW